MINLLRLNKKLGPIFYSFIELVHLVIIAGQLFIILIEELSTDLLNLLKFLFIFGLCLLPLCGDFVLHLAYVQFELGTLILQRLLKIFLGPCQLFFGHDLVSFDTCLKNLNLLIEEFVSFFNFEGKFVFAGFQLIHEGLPDLT